MRVTTAEEMRNLDRETIEVLGIPGIVLMENAARGVVSVIYSKVEGNSAVIVCGKGNN
jgi:NAD(P)H-hydrate epimerase